MAAHQHETGAEEVVRRLDMWALKDGPGPVVEITRLPALPNDHRHGPDQLAWARVLEKILPLNGSSHMTRKYVLRRRVLGLQPDTLAEVGRALGLSRERVRQIEGALRRVVDDELRKVSAVPLRQLAASASTSLGDVTNSHEVEAALTVAASGEIDVYLAERMEAGASREGAIDPWAEELDIRHGLLRLLLGRFHTVGHLLVRPRVFEVLNEARAVIARAGDGELIETVEIDALLDGAGVSAEDAGLLRAQIALRRLGTAYANWNVAMQHKAVAVLSELGRPMTFEELHEAAGFELNPSSLANAISIDERVRRLGKDRFGLATWEGEEYSGIRTELEQAISRAGGVVNIETLASEFVDMFGVSRHSVMTYANHRDFVIEDRMIRLRTAGDSDIGAVPQPIERAPGTSRINGVWHLAVGVDNDILRGSGSTLRTAVAHELGLEPDLTLGLDYGCGVVTLTWSGTQPAIGSLRRVAESLGCAEGDKLFLPLTGVEPREAFVVRREMLNGHSGLVRLQLELGLQPEKGDDGHKAILRALGLPPGSTLNAAADRLRDRGDHILAGLLPKEYL